MRYCLAPVLISHKVAKKILDKDALFIYIRIMFTSLTVITMVLAAAWRKSAVAEGEFY